MHRMLKIMRSLNLRPALQPCATTTLNKYYILKVHSLMINYISAYTYSQTSC